MDYTDCYPSALRAVQHLIGEPRPGFESRLAEVLTAHCQRAIASLCDDPPAVWRHLFEFMPQETETPVLWAVLTIPGGAREIRAQVYSTKPRAVQAFTESPQ